MNRSTKIQLTKYLVTVGVGALMAYFYVAMRDFAGSSTMERYRMLCDAFTIPGIILLAVGALVALSNEGVFYGLTYALTYFVRTLFPFGGRREQEKYYDYVERKRENRTTGYGFLFIVGAAFMAIALVFLILFYSLYN